MRRFEAIERLCAVVAMPYVRKSGVEEAAMVRYDLCGTALSDE